MSVLTKDWNIDIEVTMAVAETYGTPPGDGYWTTEVVTEATETWTLNILPPDSTGATGSEVRAATVEEILMMWPFLSCEASGESANAPPDTSCYKESPSDDMTKKVGCTFQLYCMTYIYGLQILGYPLYTFPENGGETQYIAVRELENDGWSVMICVVTGDPGSPTLLMNKDYNPDLFGDELAALVPDCA